MSNAAQVRLLPVVIAAVLLVALFKLSAYLLDDEPGQAPIASAQAQDAEGAEETQDAAGSADAASGETMSDETATEGAPNPDATGVDMAMNPDAPAAEQADDDPGEALPSGITAAEQDVLESLQQRREALDRREDEIELRERLLQATERRIEQRVAELREIEQRLEASFGRYEEQQREQLQNLVSMYENMKPKDAARIFDRLELSVLVEVVEQMSTRRMAPILAKMESEVAERLTVELAERAALGGSGADASELPDVTAQ